MESIDAPWDTSAVAAQVAAVGTGTAQPRQVLLKSVVGSGSVEPIGAPKGPSYYAWQRAKLTNLGSTNFMAHDQNGLEARMVKLQSETQTALRDLATKVDAIASALHVGPVTIAAWEPAEQVDPSQLNPDSAEMAAVFNRVADDGEITNSMVQEAALTGLTSSRGDVRAAAARAIATLNPTLAASLLPDRIKEENSGFVASVMLGALELATL